MPDFENTVSADRPSPTRAGGDADAKIREFVIEAARLIQDEHCEDILAFDVRGQSQITDYLIIATGTSDRQMRGVGHHVADLAKEYGLVRFGTDQDPATTWIALDLVEVMVHLFEPATRAHYDLEMMWGDSPKVAWQREKSEKPSGG